ncbi:MAG: DUF5671 domain-containing protein [Candidatus Paceibacterota bacterium]
MKNINTARDFFLYLFATVAAIFSAVNIIVLLWQYINYFFPAPFSYYYDGVSGAMRFSISSLIIIFPLYVWVMWSLGKDIDRHPEKKDFWVRKWLIYITLFVAAMTMIVDLVVVLNTFLGGDFAARFVLKALAVLVVAAAVFSYYTFNLKRESGKGLSTRKTIAWVSSTVLLALIVGAFFIVGSPATSQDKQLDSERVAHLSQIQWQVLDHWRQSDVLPETLDELNDPIIGFETPRDPETREDYEYTKTSDLSFELCATFASESRDFDPEATDSYDERAAIDSGAYYGGYEDSRFWQHGEGRTCFERTIDPEKHAAPKPVYY